MLEIGQWLTTFSLIFGGCCSNALALELITSQHAQTGTLITFAQFFLIAIFGLRRQLILAPSSLSREASFKLIGNRIRQTFTKFKRPMSVFLQTDGWEGQQQTTDTFANEFFDYIKRTYPDLSIGMDKAISDVSVGSRREDSIKKCDIIFKYNSGRRVNLDCDYRIYLLSSSKIVDVNSYNAFNDKHFSSVILEDTSSVAIYPPHRTWPGILLHLRFKRRHIPLTRYLIHVVLFLLVNLLNNVAFAYHIPMAVHIIFRSGGLVVNMIMGRLIEKRRYAILQVVSVSLVTFGVALTTLSSINSKPSRGNVNASISSTISANNTSYTTYAAGIGILTLALIFSGGLGLLQDRAFAKYGRGNWEEAMFYLHALGLPLFVFVGPDLIGQLRAVNSGPKVELGLQTLTQSFFVSSNSTSGKPLPPLPYLPIRSPTLMIPAFYIPLLLNVITQLVCVSGVNRLTSRVNSLTVALVLVVRKAVSLAISVLLLGKSQGNTYLWWGATAVLLGTIGYTVGNDAKPQKEKKA